MKKYFVILSVISLILSASCIASAYSLDGLIAAYLFNGNADDESGHDLNGTIHGASLTTDRFGNADSAYIFDGFEDFISVDDDPMLNFTISTISAWVNISDDASSVHMDIVSKDGETYDRQYLMTRSSLGKFRAHFADDNGGFYYYDGITSPVSGEWYHVVQTFDGNSLKLYVNGQYESIFNEYTVGGGSTDSGQPLRIGGGAPVGNAPLWFDGKIDDVFIYNRILTDNEIQDIYQPAPEPAAIFLFGSGLALFLGFRKKFKK
jgi:hypothetical protein